MRQIALGLLLLTVAGCAGRNAVPVDVQRAGDPDMTCHQVMQEYGQNNYRMTRLLREDQHIRAGNADLASGYLPVFWTKAPLLEGKFAPEIELDALRKRNARLTEMADDRRC